MFIPIRGIVSESIRGRVLILIVFSRFKDEMLEESENLANKSGTNATN